VLTHGRLGRRSRGPERLQTSNKTLWVETTLLPIEGGGRRSSGPRCGAAANEDTHSREERFKPWL
jgi:hypothetical protein